MLLSEPRINKTTAFSAAERIDLGIEGLLPARVETLDDQLARVRFEFGRLHDDLERHVYVRALQDQNEVLFYAFMQRQPAELLPIVYTPTVGLATQQFSRIYRRPRGLFLSYGNRERMTAQLAAVHGNVDVVVVTDGQRILGLGDQGVGGMAIPIGKLSLYSAFGGIDPARTLPVTLDVGTNNADLLADPLYLGARHERVTGDDYDDFVEQFVETLRERFPGVLLQWEDFAQHHATVLLDRYRSRILSFNDDIQGTAAVAVAAIGSAVKATGGRLADQRFCIVGAGSAGTGIASMLRDSLRAEGSDAPLDHVFLLDSKGLIHDRRTDLKPHQVALAHSFDDAAAWADPDRPDDLATVVSNGGITVLVGVSGQPGIFTERIVASMLDAADRPVIMPLSNPTSRAEATPEDLIAWTAGRAVVATGSPFDDVEHGGVSTRISQSNNVYIFPGLGLGACAVRATAITDGMLRAAALTLADSTSIDDVDDGVLPPLEDVPAVSRRIAAAVARQALDEGMTDVSGDEQIDARIAHYAWSPVYRTVRNG